MKKITSLMLFSLICIGMTAQDTIVMANGDEIQCKVKEVTQTAVEYKDNLNRSGPLYSVDLSDIMMIKYHNGGRDIYDNGPKTDQPVEPKVVSGLDEPFIFDKELYIKGQADAYRYYYKYKGAGTGTLLTSLLLNGLFGLIPAIGCSLTPPKMQNLCYPSQELMDNPSYCKGYKDGAKKKKQQKVWLNWGIGTIISTAIILIAASAQ